MFLQENELEKMFASKMAAILCKPQCNSLDMLPSTVARPAGCYPYGLCVLAGRGRPAVGAGVVVVGTETETGSDCWMHSAQF